MAGATLAVDALLLVFPLPAALLHAALTRRPAPGAALDSLAVGYAGSLLALYVVARWSFRLFVPLWIVGLLAALLVARRAGRPLREWLGDGALVRRLAVVAALVLAVRTLPALLHELPTGWDPYFHLVVADRIATLGTLVRDLAPYESIPLNYPIGSHVLLAFAADLTGAPLHHVFKLAIVLFGALACAQVGALAAAATRETEVGLHAAAAYGFLAVLGSLGYYEWGGLPNLLAMYLFLALLSRSAAAEAEPPSAPEIVSFAGLFVGLCVVHHHVMVTAGLCLIATAAYAWRAGGQRRLALAIAGGLAASAVLGAPYFLDYLRRAPGLDRTGIGSFREPLPSLAGDVEGIGGLFVVAAALGILLAAAARGRRVVSDVVTAPLVVMLAAYALLAYGTRVATFALLGRALSLFTPSRFLTDAVPLLAVFAGLCVADVRRRLGATPGRAAAVVIAGFALLVPVYAGLFRDDVDAGSRAAYAWIREHTEPEAGLIDTAIHGTYLARRASMAMPIPISEYVRDAQRQRLLRAIARGERPAADFGPVYVIARGSEFPRLRGRLVWSEAGSGVRILALR